MPNQDDYYVIGEAADIDAGWERLEFDLELDGHRLRRPKCSGWAPAWDDAATPQLPEETQAIFARILRSEGGMPMLGAACQSELEMAIGPFGMATDAANKRAKAATKYLQAIQRFAHSGVHQHTAHMACVLASCEPAHALRMRSVSE